MRPLVSVIIPTYNRAHFICRAVNSALSQTHDNVEVLVIDDGSTDDTAAIIRHTYGDNKKLKYFRKTNTGVAATRNVGLRVAAGDFVAFLDSDDIWKPWKVELQLDLMKALPDLGMTWTDMEAIGADGDIVSQRYLRTMYGAYRRFSTEDIFDRAYELQEFTALPVRGKVFAGDIFSPMVTGNLVHTSTALLRRSRLEGVGGFDETLTIAGEDYDFHLRTCREGRVGYIDVPTISYQIGMPDQLARKSYWMARNFLTTVEGILRSDRERIKLPGWLIREVLAGAHAWLGESLLSAGDRQQASRHFKASLRYKCWQPRTAAQLALAWLPRMAADALQRAYITVKEIRDPSP